VQIHILDLDGSVVQQRELLQRHLHQVIDMRDWGPPIRLACSHRVFQDFERSYDNLRGQPASAGPVLTLLGSGDFHHVSLALLRQLMVPFNLLVLDNHPDWMRSIPFLHCGTWLYHAARLPGLQRVFHVGGEVDFDNCWRWLAPWGLLSRRKIVVFPAVRRYRQGRWAELKAEPVAPSAERGALCAPRSALCASRMEELLEPYRAELENWPLYVSIDKDVLKESVGVTNWDAGHLETGEACAVLQAFSKACRGGLLGADIVGDWSPVVVRTWLQRLLHYTEHPPGAVSPEQATRGNERLNLTLVDAILNTCA
jgi:hypothetical protein